MAGMYVGSFTKAGASGNQDIALPAGCPNLTAAPAGSWAIMFWTAGANAASGVWDTDVIATVGFTTGPANSFSVAATASDAQVTANTARRVAAKALTMVQSDGATTYAEADFVSFPTATAMRLNWTTNIATGEQINFVIFTGLTNAKVVNWQHNTTGAKTVTGVGFRPDLVFHAMSTGVSAGSSAAHTYFSFGAMNKHGQQWSNSFASEDAINPSNTARAQQTDACLIGCNPNVTLNTQAHHQSMDADGFTAYFAQCDYTIYPISLCVSGVSSKLGAFTGSGLAGAQVVNSRHGFTPRGILTSAGGSSPQVGAFTHGTWSLGASDGTNQRVSMLLDQDGVSPTNADSAWWNTAVATGAGSFGGPAIGLASLTSLEKSTFTVSWSGSVGGYEVPYLLIGDAGVDTFPQQIDPNGATNALITSADATAYSNQKKALTLSNGYGFAVVKAAGSSRAYFYVETGDDGRFWYATSIPSIEGWSNGSIAAYVDSGGTERLVAVWKQSGSGGGRTDSYIYAMVGAFDAGRTAITWGTAFAVATNNLNDLPDLVAHAEGAGGRAHIVTSYVAGGTYNSAVYWQLAVDSAGALSNVGNVEIGTDAAVNLGTFPSIAMDPLTKRLMTAWSAGTTGAGKGIRFRTATYSGGTWTFAAAVEVDSTRYIDHPARHASVRWDGTRAVIGGYLLESVGTADVVAYETTNFTTFTTRLLHDNATAAAGTQTNYGGLAVHPTTGDIYIFGMQGNQYLHYWKWTRATATLTQHVLNSVAGDAPYFSAWFAGGKIRWIYTRGNNAPYAVVYDQLSLAIEITAVIAASGLLDAASLARTRAATAALTGGGALAATALGRKRFVNAALAGNAVLAGTVARRISLAATNLAAQGVLSAAQLVYVQQIAAALQGGSVLSAPQVSVVRALTAAIEAHGYLASEDGIGVRSTSQAVSITKVGPQ